MTHDSLFFKSVSAPQGSHPPTENLFRTTLGDCCLHRQQNQFVNKLQNYRKAPSPLEKTRSGYFSPGLKAAFDFAGQVTEPK